MVRTEHRSGRPEAQGQLLEWSLTHFTLLRTSTPACFLICSEGMTLPPAAPHSSSWKLKESKPDVQKLRKLGARVLYLRTFLESVSIPEL